MNIQFPQSSQITQAAVPDFTQISSEAGVSKQEIQSALATLAKIFPFIMPSSPDGNLAVNGLFNQPPHNPKQVPEHLAKAIAEQLNANATDGTTVTAEDVQASLQAKIEESYLSSNTDSLLHTTPKELISQAIQSLYPKVDLPALENKMKAEAPHQGEHKGRGREPLAEKITSEILGGQTSITDSAGNTVDAAAIKTSLETAFENARNTGERPDIKQWALETYDVEITLPERPAMARGFNQRSLGGFLQTA